MELLEHPRSAPPRSRPDTSVIEVDERAGRRSLREQIARLERELADAFVASYPRLGVDWQVHSVAGPRLLALGELETIRDGLAARVRSARAELTRQAEAEESNRRLIERMMLEPGRYKFVRVTREDIGERGCGAWEVRPRLGIVGMALGWWRVKISSGCPLVEGVRETGPPRKARSSGPPCKPSTLQL